MNQSTVKDLDVVFSLIKNLSEVRVYNACGAFKGVMIRDNERAYELIKEARELVKAIESGEFKSSYKNEYDEMLNEVAKTRTEKIKTLNMLDDLGVCIYWIRNNLSDRCFLHLEDIRSAEAVFKRLDLILKFLERNE